MKNTLFFRNVNGRDNLELFLVSAASSLLLVRFFLYLTGYPQLGGGGLHIAHMLYGGLLMMAAIVLMLAFLGARIRRLGALLGGIGFGVFIDELGKFLTRDNDYFFRPTIGIIYALFIGLYLVFNFLSRWQRLTPREYELNALAQFEEAVLQDLDATERQAIDDLLERADPASPVTIELRKLLRRLDTVALEQPGWLARWLTWVDRMYDRFWAQAGAGRLVGLVFLLEALLFVSGTLVTIFRDYRDIGQLFFGEATYAGSLIKLQLAAALFAAGFAVGGALKLLRSRREGFELFRRALLINLFLTEFFLFSRIQLSAMPSFIINLLLLIGLASAMAEERRRGLTA